MNASDMSGGGLELMVPYSLNFALWVSRQPWLQSEPALAMVWEIWWQRLVLVRRMDPPALSQPSGVCPLGTAVASLPTGLAGSGQAATLAGGAVLHP